MQMALITFHCRKA